MTNSTWYQGYVIGALIFQLFLGTSYVALGQEKSTTTEERAKVIRETIDERRGEIQNAVQEQRAEIASSTDEFKARLEEHRTALAQKLQDRVYNLLANITGRMQAGIFRLESIAERIETRTQKLVPVGVNGTEVYAELLKARASLESAKVLLASDLGSFVTSDKPREKYIDVRTKLKEAGSHIRDAHQSLITAFAALKQAVADADLERGKSEAVRPPTSSTTTPVPSSPNQ